MAGCITEQEMNEILNRFQRYKNVKVFVETGTFRAETISKMSNMFQKCYTIELSKKLYDEAKEKYSDRSIHFYHGDSSIILSQIIENINESAIFFFDAHYCGRKSAKGIKDVPLLQELDLIVNRPYCDLLIIDDFRLFSTKKNEDWSEVSINSILNVLKPKIPFWKRMIYRGAYSVSNDRMIIPL